MEDRKRKCDSRIPKKKRKERKKERKERKNCLSLNIAKCIWKGNTPRKILDPFLSDIST